MSRKTVGEGISTAIVKGSDTFGGDAATLTFRKTAFNSLESAFKSSDSPNAKALFTNIDSTVKSDILGSNFNQQSTKAFQKLIRDAANDTPDVFDNFLIKLSDADTGAFTKFIGTLDDVTLRAYYNEIGEGALGTTLKERLKQAAVAAGKGADFFGGSSGAATTRDEIKVVITNAALRSGVDTADDAATKSWLKGVLGVGKASLAVAPAAIGIYYFMNIAHAITGMSYLDLAAALLNPASLFDGDSDNSDDDGDDDGGSSILSTLGIVMVGLMGIVGITFAVRLFKTVTG